MPQARVLCVGVAVLDNIFAIDRFPREPTKVFAHKFGHTGGGPAANGAVTVARLGGAASLWARVGGDAVGRIIVDELAACEVDVRKVRRVEGGRSGVSAVLIDEGGDRFITAFADRTLDADPSWLPLDEIGSYDAVLCDVRWPAASETVLRAARLKGVRTILDADLTNDDAVPRLLGLADYAVFSAPALTRLSGQSDPEVGLRAAQERTPGAVAVTLGDQGFAWLEDGVFHRRPAFSVTAIDTLAAGDVFHGAFALGVAEGLSIAEAGSFAAAAAAVKCTRWGGRAGIPSRAELEAFLGAQTERGDLERSLSDRSYASSP
jgi:sulfofructose kinase